MHTFHSWLPWFGISVWRTCYITELLYLNTCYTIFVWTSSQMKLHKTLPALTDRLNFSLVAINFMYFQTSGSNWLHTRMHISNLHNNNCLHLFVIWMAVVIDDGRSLSMCRPTFRGIFGIEALRVNRFEIWRDKSTIIFFI